MLNLSTGLIIGTITGLIIGGMLGILFARLLCINHLIRTPNERRSRRHVSFPIYCSNGVVALVDRRRRRPDRRLSNIAIKY
jgi:hypothetical protein